MERIRPPDRLTFSNREEWLQGRESGIGASEAAIICGLSKWQTPTQLWEVKTGRTKAKNISNTDYVQRGTKAEEHIRQLFMLLHPEYELEYHAYDILYQQTNPWLRATLDGELIGGNNGERGILEIKKSEISRKTEWEEWNRQIPQHYFCQICHQFIATGYEFAWLYAWLINPMTGKSELRPYYYLRKDCIGSMQWVFEQEKTFWHNYVEGDKQPPAILKL